MTVRQGFFVISIVLLFLGACTRQVEPGPTTTDLPACHIIYDAGSKRTRLYVYQQTDIGWLKHAGPKVGALADPVRKERGKTMADARAVADAGACAVVLEGIPAKLACEISKELSIPTIGIGAGVDCDGQVLVIHDILGLCEKYSPKFVKRYADVSGTIRQGIDDYIREVKDGTFPGPEHSF